MMKVIRNSLFVLTGIAIAFACSKDAEMAKIKPADETNVSQNAKPSGNSPVVDEKQKSKNSKTGGGNGLKKLTGTGEDMDCVGTHGNCFDPFDVEAEAKNIFNDFTNVVNGGPQEIGDFFNGGDWPTIFDYLPQSEIDKLQSYDYDIVELEGKGDHIRYFLAGDVSSGEEVGRYYYDFVIRLNDELIQ